MNTEVGESSSSSRIPSDNNGEKTVIVRVKRKADQSPLDAFCKFSTPILFYFILF